MRLPEICLIFVYTFVTVSIFVPLSKYNMLLDDKEYKCSLFCSTFPYITLLINLLSMYISNFSLKDQG